MTTNRINVKVGILSFIEQQVEYLHSCKRYGTARNYMRTKNSLASYCNSYDLPLSSVDEAFIEGYNLFLQQRGIVRNSISFYMRILRAVYNKAARQHLVEQLSGNPFINVYTGIDRTRKRAVNEKIITKLYKLDLKSSPVLSLARDMFVFSYCTRGMAFVDMAYLCKSNIKGGEICYSRHKTDQQLAVRIEPAVQRIIDRYANPVSGYIFPILKSGNDAAKNFMQYQIALNYYNRQLKRLSGMLQLDCCLTSYVARHSWATSARKHNILLSVISAGMGHTSERTTQIYLKTLENNVIDKANRRIISCLL